MSRFRRIASDEARALVNANAKGEDDSSDGFNFSDSDSNYDPNSDDNYDPNSDDDNDNST